MSHERLLFTSESVTAGHPDKLCDAISDAILDACLQQDPNARVACETVVKGTDETSSIILAGEITCAPPQIDYEAVARKTAADIGYTDHAFGMNAETCDVQLLISTQDILHLDEDAEPNLEYCYFVTANNSLINFSRPIIFATSKHLFLLTRDANFLSSIPSF